jgi:hypothetical protein
VRIWLFCPTVTETDDIKEAVLRSLREQPTLNTPTLIADNSEHLPEGVGNVEIERALAELVEAGLVKHRTTGWKLAPRAA